MTWMWGWRMFDVATPSKTMTSREIADLTEKRHDNVKRVIESCASKGVFTLPQIEETSFKGVDGRGQTVSVYLLDKRSSLIVVAQLCPEFTARVVDRWQELEASANQPEFNPASLSRMEILRLAMESEEARVKAEAELKIAAPLAAVTERIYASQGSRNLTEAAKELKIQRKILIRILMCERWVYRRSDSAPLMAYDDKRRAGLVEHGYRSYTNMDGEQREASQVLITNRGLVELAKLCNNPGYYAQTYMAA